MAWRGVDGEWQIAGGSCLGARSAARAEIEALVQVCKMATRPCVITADCKGAVMGFRAVQSTMSLLGNLARGPCADLWQSLLHALQGPPAIAVRWMPAHCTKEELCARGGSEEGWSGNGETDKRAKWEARRLAPSEELVKARLRQLDK